MILYYKSIINQAKLESRYYCRPNPDLIYLIYIQNRIFRFPNLSNVTKMDFVIIFLNQGLFVGQLDAHTIRKSMFKIQIWSIHTKSDQCIYYAYLLNGTRSYLKSKIQMDNLPRFAKSLGLYTPTDEWMLSDFQILSVSLNLFDQSKSTRISIDMISASIMRTY